MAPQTGFEITGQWTTLEDEKSFLDTVVAETDATLAVVGHTVKGKPIYRVDLGAGPDNTMLIVCMQHGTEPASREAALQQIRNLAYSTDPAVTEYLDTHRIVWVPSMNADQIDTLRENAVGVNLNLDWHILSQPETEAVAGLIHDIQPNLIIDAHEYFSGGTDWLGRGGGMPDTHPEVKALGIAAHNHVIDTMTSRGHTAGVFATNPAQGSLAGIAGDLNIVGMLSESDATTSTPTERVDAQISVMEMMREWHEEHGEACHVARQVATDWALTNTDPVPLQVDHKFVGDLPPEIVDLEGYQLREPLAQKYTDLYGITADKHGFVTLLQPARRLVPHILDRTAMKWQHLADRVLHGEPHETPPGPVFRVMVDGEVSDVADIVVKLDGERFGVIGVDAR